MLRAHRQAWVWQDEYYGLTIEDIRRLEEETQRALQERMAAALREEEGSTISNDYDTATTQEPAKVMVNDAHIQKASSKSSIVAPSGARKTSIGSVRSRRSGGPGVYFSHYVWCCIALYGHAQSCMMCHRSHDRRPGTATDFKF